MKTNTNDGNRERDKRDTIADLDRLSTLREDSQNRVIASAKRLGLPLPPVAAAKESRRAQIESLRREQAQASSAHDISNAKTALIQMSLSEADLLAVVDDKSRSEAQQCAAMELVADRRRERKQQTQKIGNKGADLRFSLVNGLTNAAGEKVDKLPQAEVITGSLVGARRR